MSLLEFCSGLCYTMVFSDKKRNRKIAKKLSEKENENEWFGEDECIRKGGKEGQREESKMNGNLRVGWRSDRMNEREK